MGRRKHATKRVVVTGFVAVAGLLASSVPTAGAISGSGSQFYSSSGITAGAPESFDSLGVALAMGDFDNDGHVDIALGAPGEDLGSATDAGAVVVIYGTASGLSRTNSVQLSSAGVLAGSPERGDRFGSALAVGDFDDDGFDDLAVGAYSEDLGSASDAGAVVVIYGSGGGLNPSDSEQFSQAGAMPGANEQDDWWGYALAVGDFDNDGVDDLAVGAPKEDIGLLANSGAVTIMYGSGSGLRATDAMAFSQAGAYAGGAEAEDYLGYALAAGDTNGDGYDDLAIGAPRESIGTVQGAGAVLVVRGSASGIRSTGSRMISQSTAGVPGGSEVNDWFGESVTMGDFDDDGRDDILVGYSLEDISGATNTGAATVLYGSSSGTTAAGSTVFSEFGPLAGTGEVQDLFGRAVSAGDIDGDGYDDAVVGAPGETLGVFEFAGAIVVIYGSASGLRTTGSEQLSQSGSVVGSSELNDIWGNAVLVGDVDGNGRADVLVGAPGESIGTIRSAGAATLLFG